jgi:hypothetical protein
MLSLHNNTRLLSGPSWKIQVASTPTCVVLDVESRLGDTEGRPRSDHAWAALSLSEATRLGRLLQEVIAAAEEVPDGAVARLPAHRARAPQGDDTLSLRHLYAVHEAAGDPLTIPVPPSRWS